MYFCFRKGEGIAYIDPNDTAAEEDQEKEYFVERVLDKRIKNNNVQYFLKWNGYVDKYNTWEPEENLDCKDLINDFEQKERKKKEKLVCVKIPIKKIPQKIMNATNSSGQLEFSMKWRGIKETELIPAKEANLKWPQIVIKFYEERLEWNSD